MQEIKQFFINIERKDINENMENLVSEDFIDSIDIDFRENYLLLYTKGIVATTVKLALDAFEVADTRQGYADKPLKKFIHAVTAQSNHYTDRHLLTKLEVRDILF